MISLRLLALSAILALPAGAQHARITGVVYDSVAMAPLSGAIVQLALVNDSAGQRTFSATSDATGHYSFSDLPAGSYGIGFQHAALTALGLDAPLRALRLTDASAAEINLAIPSGQQVRALACGSTAGDSSDAFLVGYVMDAVRGGALKDATVGVHWTELGLVDKKFKAVPRDISATIGDDGAFRICGVASDAQIQLTVAHAGFRGLSTDITLPPGAAVRHDFRLVDSALTRGAAAITGRVTHDDGSPVASGQVLLSDLGIDAPIANGQFSLAGLPPGTWSLETRVLGYEPQTTLVEAVDGAPATVTVKIANKIQVLDAVTVFGKVTNDMKTLTGIVDRRRTAFGTTFLPGNSWLQSALYITDVLQAARGFRYYSMDSVNARGCTEATSIMGTTKKMLIYLDGTRFAGDLSDLQHQVPIRDVLAVEAYPDPQSIPAIFRSSDACAAVLVWTKR